MRFFWRCRRFSEPAEAGLIGARGAGWGENEGHRPYEPGDDARLVDWPAYARSGRLFTRLERRGSQVAVRVLVDVSDSMIAGNGEKVRAAFRFGVALAASFVAGGDKARLEFFSNTWRGQTSWLQRLSDVTPFWRRGLAGVAGQGGASDWQQFARRVQQEALRMSSTRALLVVSDFWGQGAVEAIGNLAASGFEIFCVIVLSSQERRPPWRGSYRLQDAETGAEISALLDEKAAAEYSKSLEERVRLLKTHCRRAAGDAIVVPPTHTWQEALFACWRTRMGTLGL